MSAHTLLPPVASTELEDGNGQQPGECESDHEVPPSIVPNGARRRLCQQHFAVYRGYLEGLPIEELVDRYLGPAEVASPREALRAIRDELSMAAARLGRHKAVKLLRESHHGSTAALAGAKGLPTLEEFRARYDPDGVLSEMDLLISYREAYDPISQEGDAVRRTRRQSDIRRRQFTALNELAKVLAEAPLAQHRLAGWVEWIGLRVAERLAKVSLNTVAELVDYINMHGYRWFKRVPRLGEKTAQRLVCWLDRHADTIERPLTLVARRPQRSLAPTELAAQRTPNAGVAPLEYYLPPAALDGTAGSNRAPAELNRIGANNDYDAIQLWVGLEGISAHTQRARRKEAERFLQWAIIEQRKPLSSLTTGDVAAYVKFLADPQPSERWITTRRIPRWHADWRPFDGPLSMASQATTFAILSSLCTWLARQRYLYTNPFDGVPKPQAAVKDPRERSLSREQWSDLVNRGLAALSEEARPRARFALWLAYGTGLRLAELTCARLGDLQHCALDGTQQGAWMLKVVGKRQRVRYEPFPPALFDALLLYLKSRGLGAAPASWPTEAPLLAPLSGETPLTHGAVAALYKSIFTRAFDASTKADTSGGPQLRRASAQWLRHTHGRHAGEAGTPAEIIAANLGLASLASASAYVHTDYRRQLEEVDKFLSSYATEEAPLT
ncbi:phage integrase family protein [Cupriavidus oxalaticus]|uniref:phage integrase family protein n=1 Tax=Cupriavidus oxalaticus TaxID=96344 RepID=UPI00316C9840